jgi:glyoxylase-like metal-dependent hydrolase (beta-lactamase superfamily II)
VRVDDGIVFDPSSVVAEEIRKEAGYGGARVLIAGVLDGARCRTQIDVGFGDAVTPADAALGQEVLARYQRDFFYAPRPDAQGYADGACWELGGCRIRAFHMPGHTAGHTVLLVEPEGVAFIGDIDLSGFGPYYGDAGSNLRDFRATLQRLPELPAKVWVTSHHRGVYTERDRFLRDLAAFAAKIDERSARLRALLAESPKTLAQLVACRLLYPPGHQSWWIDSAEARTIVQHLDELQAAGQVQVDAEGVWRLC